MRDLDFQNPEACGGARLKASQVARLVDRVGEIADPMPFHFPVETPTHALRCLQSVEVQFFAAPSSGAPACADVMPQRTRGFGTAAHFWIIADDKRVPRIALMPVPDDAKIDEVDVVSLQDACVIHGSMESL